MQRFDFQEPKSVIVVEINESKPNAPELILGSEDMQNLLLINVQMKLSKAELVIHHNATYYHRSTEKSARDHFWKKREERKNQW